MFLFNHHYHLRKYLVLVLAGMTITGCKKLVEIDSPSNMITGESVFTSDATAAAVMTGIYTNMSNTYFPPSFYLGLSADELSLWSGSSYDILIQLHTNSLTIQNAWSIPYWGEFYNRIFTCNSVLEALEQSKALTPAVRLQLLGEARFMRAFHFFYLVNLFGDVPLTLKTDYTINIILPRSPKAEVYKQIILDLKEAQQLLQDGYMMGDAMTVYKTDQTERVRPNKSTATALLARVYLYTNDLINAEKEATALIDNTAMYRLTSLDGVFLKNSSEAIWQLQPVASGWNTSEAQTFILPSTGLSNGNPYYLSKYLVDAFEAGDDRKDKWTNTYSIGGATYYYPYKYKSAEYDLPVTEYSMVFRLAEQFMIRAEARARQENISGAAADLDSIRIRAGLLPTPANSKEQLLQAIVHEKQVELFTEWGIRWCELKRLPGFTNPSISLADEVMPVVTTYKGGVWNTNWQLYPIPLEDVKRNPNLGQSPGY